MQTAALIDNDKFHILLVEDDPQQRELVSNLIEQEYEVTATADGESAIAAAEAKAPNLIVLDIGLPLEVCRRIRAIEKMENVPIIFLTGNSDRDTRATAFDVGADDLLEKPFYSRELLSRIRAKLRRQVKSPAEGKIIRQGDLVLDLSRMEVNAAGKPSALSPLECSLLSLFLRHSETVLSREVIMARAWGGTKVSHRTVDTHVVSIRKAIGPSSFRVETIYGAGYMLTSTPRKRSSASTKKKAR